VTPLIFIFLLSIPPILGIARNSLSYSAMTIASAAVLVLSILSVNESASVLKLGSYISFRLDPLSSLFLMIASVVWIASSTYSISYDRTSRSNSIAFSLSILSMAAVILSGTYFTLLFSWEMMSVAGYLQILSRKKIDASPPYLFILFSEVSTLLLLLMAADIYASTGTLVIGPRISVTAFILGAFGFAIKLGVTPFFISDWLPEAHSAAPANGSVLFSATMTMTAVYCILRLISFSRPYIAAGVIMMAAGAFTLVFASIFAAAAENVKAIPAYSTVENGGAMLIALGIVVVTLYYKDAHLAAFATGAVLVYVAAHTFGKAGLFMYSGILGKGAANGNLSEIDGGTDAISSVGGILSAVSLAGLLPFGGGVGEWMLLEALFILVTSANYGLSVISVFVGASVALGGGMSLISMSKLAGFGTSGTHAHSEKSSDAGVLISGGSVLLLGILSTYIIYFSNSAIEEVSGQSFDKLISGLLAVPQGLLITSPGPHGTFGLVSPLFVAAIISVSAVAVLAITAPGRRKRKVRIWSGGMAGETGSYSSFEYSNPVRMMFRHIFGGGVMPLNREWKFLKGVAKIYSAFSDFSARRIMNSSISRYMLYIVAALLAVLIYSAL